MLIGMTPVLVELQAYTSRKMELGCKVIPYQKRSKVEEGGLIGLLCSRSARSRTSPVGRAQWETDSGLPPGEGIGKFRGSIKL